MLFLTVNDKIPNPPLYVKMIMTALLSILAVVLFCLNKKSKTRLYCMIAMLLCSVGDVFMTNLFKIDSFASLVIGASSFMAGHVFYGLMFMKLSKQAGGKVKNKGFVAGIIFMLVTLAIQEILGWTYPQEKNTMMLLLVPVYIALIGFHLSMAYSYGYKIKGVRGFLLPASITLFYATDVWIFLNMFNICNIEHLIWYFYPLGQLGIILLSTKIGKKSR